ncbi:hypothetical protein BDQ12DRAFT_673385 [Crucibulum laeve]|uniref:Secreted protein n=1 Tax=Crucibulum laeve TaxID=68775 RepID=A0A5C3MTH1_9AGAR|nr:hypothetical protein BDQ12DRAFT_673385 [Crucibulum laeve]
MIAFHLRRLILHPVSHLALSVASARTGCRTPLFVLKIYKLSDLVSTAFRVHDHKRFRLPFKEFKATNMRLLHHLRMSTMQLEGMFWPMTTFT